MRELETALLRDPDDLASLLAYADLLQSRGDPRGEWIALQHAASQRADDDALRDECERFLRRNQNALLGPLAAAVSLHGARGRGWGLSIEWQLGFMHAVEVGLPVEANSRAAGRQMRALIAHPAACRLERLTLGAPEQWSVWTKPGAWIDALVEAPPLPGVASALPLLRTLEIHSHGDADVELDRLWRKYPGLESVLLDVSRCSLGLIVAPALRSLEIRRGFGVHHIESLVAAECPALSRLVLRGGTPFPTVLDLIGEPLPELVILGLVGTTNADLVVRRLVGSRWAAQLEALDLRQTDLTSDGAEMLTAAAFPRLRWLGLPALADETLAELRSWCESIHTVVGD